MALGGLCLPLMVCGYTPFYFYGCIITYIINVSVASFVDCYVACLLRGAANQATCTTHSSFPSFYLPSFFSPTVGCGVRESCHPHGNPVHGDHQHHRGTGHRGDAGAGDRADSC